jgi:serine/threonine protein kinase
MSGQPCPAREELHAFHVGTLVDDRSEALIEHISTCPGCQATLETLGTAGDALLERLRSPAPCDPYEEEPDCQEAVATIQAMAETTLTVAARPPVPAPATPSRLGEYEVLEKLGEGGMGAVYKARHTRLDRMAALKVLPKERTVSPDAVARFEREMKAVGRLSHANIVQAHDARDIEGTTVLVMEYVEGKDLSLLVQEAGALPIADACELLRQAALGLQYAHEHGLVHRDIKPSNLMLTHEGRVKILDLGLALLRTEQTGGEEITAAGQVMGTADYLAPEQVTDSHQVDIRADIYSLGCTLYKLLSGRAPFGHLAARGAMAKMLAHVQEPPLPIRSLRADVPEALAAVLGRMLAKAPAERFATPGEVAEALAPFTAGANVAALLAAAQVASGPSAATEALAPATDPAVLSAMTGTQPSPSAPTVGRAGQPQAAPAPKPLATPWKPRNRVAALAAGAAAAVVLLGVVIIIKDRFGRQTVVNVPGSDVTIEVRPDGELSKVASPPSPPAPPACGRGE